MKITATVELKITMEAASAAEAHRRLLRAYEPIETMFSPSVDKNDDFELTVVSRHVRIWPAKGSRR